MGRYFLSNLVLAGSMRFAVEFWRVNPVAGFGMKRSLCKVFPFLQNKKQPGIEQSRDDGSKDDAASNLWIIAIPFQLQTENPSSR